MKPIQTISTILLSSVLFCHCSKHITNPAAQTVAVEPERRLKLNPGQKIYIDNTLSMTNSLEMMGQQMDMEMEMKMTKQLEVKEKKGTSYNLVGMLTKISGSTKMMGQEMNFDSEKKDDNSEMAKTMQGMLNAPVEFEINDNGKVVSVKKDTAKKSDNTDMIASMINGLTTGGDDATSAEDAFLVLPKNINAGYKWSDSAISNEGKLYKEYTVVSTNDDSTKVSFTGKQTVNKTTEAQGMEITASLENKLTGEILVDKKTGVIIRKSVSAEGSGTTEVMGQSVPTATKSTSISEIKQL